jgi:hypothetical protein
MGQRYPPTEQIAGTSKSIAHVAEEEEFGRGHAIGMRRNPPLTDVNLPIWKELAQMIVGPAVAEPELEHKPIQFLNETCRKIEASALSLQSAYEAVEPAHGRQATIPAPSRSRLTSASAVLN